MARFAFAKVLGTAVVLVSATQIGCVAEKDDAERFREAIPQSEEVALKVPGSSGEGTKTKGLGIRTNDAARGTARYYRFTRDMTSAVDFGTAVILGSIWLIVHTQPTSVESKRAVWGPGQGNALEPVIYRFTVDEVGDKEYDYVLEGQRKGTNTFLPLLRGHGYGKEHPDHRRGWFEADNEAYRKLDPDRAKDHGTTKVTFDLARIPATIKVELRGEGGAWADVTVGHEAKGAGTVTIAGLVDIDDSKATKLEDLKVLSQWTSTGSGRADVEMKNGDMPFTVTASECWSETFARVFYKDSIDFEPASGDAAACAVKPAQ